MQRALPTSTSLIVSLEADITYSDKTPSATFKRFGKHFEKQSR